MPLLGEPNDDRNTSFLTIACVLGRSNAVLNGREPTGTFPVTTIPQLRAAHEAGLLPKPYFLGSIFGHLSTLSDLQNALKGTQIKEILVAADNFRIRTADFGLELFFHPEEANSLVTGLLAFGDVEPMERKALLAAAKTASTILDVGANIGWYSLHFARVAPQACIHAFEPSRHIQKRLLDNLALNGITSVITEQLALQDHEGSDTLYFHPAETGATSVHNNRGFAGVQREEIRCTTLDRYCAQHDLQPDLIKCDVEGGELSVIKGGIRTLRESQPVVFLELLRKWSANFGYHPNEVIDLMSDLGYRAWAIESSGIQPCAEIMDETIATNFLFTCDGKHNALIQQLTRP